MFCFFTCLLKLFCRFWPELIILLEESLQTFVFSRIGTTNSLFNQAENFNSNLVLVRLQDFYFSLNLEQNTVMRCSKLLIMKSDTFPCHFTFVRTYFIPNSRFLATLFPSYNIIWNIRILISVIVDFLSSIVINKEVAPKYHIFFLNICLPTY